MLKNLYFTLISMGLSHVYTIHLLDLTCFSFTCRIAVTDLFNSFSKSINANYLINETSYQNKNFFEPSSRTSIQLKYGLTSLCDQNCSVNRQTDTQTEN